MRHIRLCESAAVTLLLLAFKSPSILLLPAHKCLFDSKCRLSLPGMQVQQTKVQQAQREVERLQRSLSARDALIQQLKTQRANDTPAREVHGPYWGILVEFTCRDLV